MKPMFSNFTLVIVYFWAFFEVLSLFFDKLAPLNICFKRCFKSLFSPFQCKNSLSSAKNVIFSLFCILVDRPWGGAIAPPPRPSGCATVCELSFPSDLDKQKGGLSSLSLFYYATDSNLNFVKGGEGA